MQTTFILNFCGLLCNLTGAILLAITLSKYLTAIHSAHVLHDQALRGLVSKQTGNILVAEGLDARLKKEATPGVWRTRIALGLIAVGYLLQLAPYVMLVLYR